jgi:type I restriction-modification system DNA methylase subunit
MEYNRLSLFNKKFIKKQIAVAPTPDTQRVAAFKEWAADIKSGKIATHSEVSLHGPFVQKILVEALGYSGPIGNDAYNVTQEKGITRGSVDVAIGNFEHGEGQILAPFELKGADTKNLDAIMSGRAKSPVDQAWEYATNNVGTKWVLVSNYLEIRLYSYGEGRQVYETFDLSKLHEPAEYARIQLLLSAESLLSGRTFELLEESRRENKDITNALYLDYKKLRSELIEQVQRELPDLDPLAAIRTGQKILDRILFIAFAEDTRLLPKNTLENAYKHADPYHPRPVWETFLSLFKAIDEGSEPLKVPRYNGGLFATDDTISSLKMPDHICEGFKALSEYDFESEVSVTVLGHIFEQSIADVEQLQAEARGETVEAKKTTGTSGRRKRDGVVYTPDYIARFIVEQTLGTHCREIFDALLLEHAQKGATRADDPIKWKSAVAEKKFWQAYRASISKLRIVDPACGSGVFLVMAFDWLKAELMRCNSVLEKLGEGALFEPDSEILTHNLFGVDVNEESVEIAKLSLWIKTARHGKVLDSLDDNFRVGDSLIEDSSYAYRSHGFVWKEAFKEVFDEGGFDIVLGNPPYVRQERLKDLKPWLQGRFEVYHGVADLYAYFFERGMRILKPGGRMGYISSSTFFKIKSGAPLRDFLCAKAALETVVDFGDHQIFEGVTTYPAILTMQCSTPTPQHEFKFWKIGKMPAERFADTFAEASKVFPQKALKSSSWELEGDALRELRCKIVDQKTQLVAVYGKPFRGVTTGKNEAFVVNQSTYNQLIAKDVKSKTHLKPWIEGRDLERWIQVGRDQWIIFARQGLDLEGYPAIREHLSAYRPKLEPKPEGWIAASPNETWPGRKSGSYHWSEIQDKTAYWEIFSKEKIISTKISSRPTFSVDRSGGITSNTTYVLDAGDDNDFLTAVLNSKVAFFYFRSVFAVKSGGFFEIQPDGLSSFPIPPATRVQKAELGVLAKSAQTAAQARYALQHEVTRRIPDLANGMAVKLTERLKAWWNLPDFAAFQAEVKKALKSDIPLKDRNDWENWISENRAKIHALTAEISRIENEINTKVYALFDLMPDEIKLLESSI